MKIEIDAKELSALANLLTQQNAPVVKVEINAKEFIDKDFLADLTDKVCSQLTQQLEESARIHDA